MLSFSLASPSLLPFQGKQVPGILHWKKKLCKRDGSGGRVFSGCPGATFVALEFIPTIEV